MSDINEDRRWMSRALALAARGGRAVQPNPLVGALLVKDGRLIGEGWHRAVGSPHAEREALAACDASPSGATLYVTLEPCHRQGRTPPCTDAILEAGVSRVVFALEDPNPAEAGRSRRLLAEAGVDVSGGLLAEEAAAQNEIYVHCQRSGRPWVLLKSAATINGMLARANGESKWISGEAARRQAHEMRASVGAVALGAETARLDRPRLDLRLLQEADQRPLPRPVVFAGASLSCPPDLDWRGRAPILLHPTGTDAAAFAELDWRCIEIAPDPRGGVDLDAALRALALEGISSLMVEGGGRLNTAFLASDLWERWELFLAPRLFPADGRSLWTALAERDDLRIAEVRQVGEDLRITINPLGRGREPVPRGTVSANGKLEPGGGGLVSSAGEPAPDGGSDIAGADAYGEEA